LLCRVTGNTTSDNLRLVVTSSYPKTGAYLVRKTQRNCYKYWCGHLLLPSSPSSSSSSSQGLGFFSQYSVYTSIVFFQPCCFCFMCLTSCFCEFVMLLYCTVELHLPGLIGTANHPDMQKIRIIGFFFENRLRGHFELEQISTNGCFMLHIYFRTNEH